MTAGRAEGSGCVGSLHKHKDIEMAAEAWRQYPLFAATQLDAEPGWLWQIALIASLLASKPAGSV